MDLRSKDAIESSKQHDIDMDNILIAEFMGVNIITIDDIRSNKNPYISSADGYTEEDLQYHKSWDWLMPVIKKCRATEVDKDRELSKQRLIDNINFCLFTLDLLGTHGNIIYFIKWYERKPIVTTF